MPHNTKNAVVVDATGTTGIETMSTEVQSDSPLSLPSIAATSVASSQADHDDDDYVVRELFITDERKPNRIVENIQRISEHDAEGREAYGSSISITSSETTVAAAGNLTTERLLEIHDGSFPLVFEPHETLDMYDIAEEEICCNSESSAGDNDTRAMDKENTNPDIRETEYVEEDPPEQMPSCHGVLSLTPRQIAELFMAYETRKLWPHRSADTPDHENTPPVRVSPDNNEFRTPLSPLRKDNWMPRAESLEKECAALKRIIQEDSKNIFNLKRTMEARKDLVALKDKALLDKQFELQVALDRIESLKKDKDIALERESELEDTIHILKNEVDGLTQLKSSLHGTEQPDEIVPSESNGSELEDLKRYVELYSSQVVTQEMVITDLKAQVLRLEKDKLEMQAELSEMHCLREQSKEDHQFHAPKAPTLPTLEDTRELVAVVEDISKRLKALEQKREAETDVDAHHIQPGKRSRAADVTVSLDPEKIEASLPNHQSKTNGELWCCDASFW